MAMTKTEAKKLLSESFTPNGGSINIKEIRFRKTLEDEIHRCCERIGDDCQSGFLYCADIAEYVGFCWAEKPEGSFEIGFIGFCKKHAKKLSPDFFSDTDAMEAEILYYLLMQYPGIKFRLVKPGEKFECCHPQHSEISVICHKDAKYIAFRLINHPREGLAIGRFTLCEKHSRYLPREAIAEEIKEIADLVNEALGNL